MIKVKDGYAKLIGTTYTGTADRVLLSNGGDFGLHTGRNNEANKIVRTDASGYIQAGWINTTSGDMGTTDVNRIYCSNDGYIRYKTPANFFSTLANDSNQLSITIGDQNRKVTVAYATTATSLGPAALKHMCSLYATGTYNAYKIITNWHKSWIIMPTISIRGYAYGTSRTIDCDIVMYHFNNTPCNYSLTNKGSYPIRVWQAIENDVQVFYVNPGEYYGMFNVFVYSGIGTSTFTNWTIAPVDAISGTEIDSKPIATSITGNAATATKLTTSAGNAALPIYFSDGQPITCTASSIFSNLSNDGNNISITVAGQNRTLTVNYANSAGYTKRLYANSISGLTTYPGDYSLAYSRFQAGVSNIFPTINNANGVITAHLHYGDYFAQIGLSSDGRMYYRTMMDQTLDAGVTWNKVAWTTDIPTSLPASDVYDWAKQPTKPSYSFSEITPGVATIGDGTNRLMFRLNASWMSGMYYSTPGSESMVFANRNPATSWIFANTNPTANTNWTTLTPSLQIKNGRVTINKLIANNTDAPYNLDVNGSANATILYENGVRVSVSGHTHDYLPLSGGAMDSGSHVIFPGSSTDASYGGSIEFREVNYVNTNQTDWLYAPGITFHWGGRSVGKLGLRSDGDLAWRDQSIIHSGNINSQSVNYANSANKLNKWFSSRIEDLNQQFGDGALRIFNSTSSTTANKCPSDSSILHLAWDNNNGYDSQLALDAKGNNIYFRGQNGGTWSPWKTVLHNGNSSISGNTITINGSSITVSKSDHTHSYLPLIGGTLSGNLTIGQKDANRIISIAGNTSHLKMIAHTNATYIESGNKDWNGNTPLLVTGYSGNQGSNLYLYFANIYCRNNSYVNLDSGNWSNYITIPTATSQLTNDSGFLTSRGYIGRTTVQATAAAQSLTGIGNITPETANTYYLGASDKPWYQIFCRYFTSDLVSLSSSSNSGSLAYSSTSGYFYITANNIAANTSGGFVMKTIKNGVLSQIVLESGAYGQIRTTGDLYIGGRVSNTTALISSDAAHNMYISVQGKALLVCDSSENSIRRGKNQADNITLGTASCPWEGLYVKNSVKLKGKTNYFSIQAPNGTHSSDEIFSLPYTGGTLVTTNSAAMVKGWATYSFSYTNGTSSTYATTFKAGGGVNIVNSYYEYYNGPGILIRIDDNCKDTSGTIKDSLMVWGQASVATQSLYITKTTVQVSGSTTHYYLVQCTNTSGTPLTSGSGTLNFIYF